MTVLNKQGKEQEERKSGAKIERQLPGINIMAMTGG
jgi:hypothetical protein